MDIGITTILPPAVEPVSLTDVRLNLKVEVDVDDPLIERCITVARMHAESKLHRALCTTTFKLWMDVFPAEIQLWRPPLQSVTAIEYVDTSGDLQTLDAEQYQVSQASEPGRVRPSYGNSWPSVREQMEAVQVTYTAGYGAAADVPKPIQQFIYAFVVLLYEQRSPIITAGTLAKAAHMDGLLDPYRTGVLY